MVHLQFRPDLSIDFSDSAVSIGAGFSRYNFGGISPASRSALMALQAKPCDEDQLIDQILSAESGSTLPMFLYLLNQLKQQGLLCYSVATGPLKGLNVVPQADPFSFEPGSLSTDRSFRWSPMAYFRMEDGQWRLSCPLGNAQITGIDQPFFWELVSCLSNYQTLGGLADTFPQLTLTEWRSVVALLQAARTLDWQETDERAITPEQTWEFHDLLFHSRSRLGKHHYPYGGTFPMRGKGSPPSAIVDWPSEQIIKLSQPPPPAAQPGPGLWDVLERRSSVRTYDDTTPIDLEKLAHLLYYTSRTKGVWPTPDGDVTRKPYPSGGGLYELEVYPVVAQCSGIDGGLYHYDSLHHQLRQLSPLNAEIRKLLDFSWFTAGRESRPQVVLVVTARFQRINWKYQSVAYALILKHVGVLYQTLYLAATALNLAPCALGGGDASLFAKAAGLNELEETSVGEFMLGSLPPA